MVLIIHIKTRMRKMNGDWEYQMEVLTKRKKIIEISETIDKVLYEWYSERGREVPNWKRNTNHEQWWINYLNELKDNEI